MKKFKLIAVATLIMHVMTFAVPRGFAEGDGWVVMDNSGNVISQNDGNTTNVNVVDGNSYNVVNGDIALDQIININVLNGQGIADSAAKAIFNFNDGHTSDWAGVLNLVGTAAFVNAFGYNVAQSFQGNISGGAILSSLGINEAQFFAGIAELSRGSQDPAAIINKGTFNLDPHSFLALVGSAVQNLGEINANGGTAILAAGDKVTLGLSGSDGLISVSVDQAINAPVYDKNGNKISDVISNSGVIRANGGLAVLSAKAAETLFDNIVNHSGIIEANSLGVVNGRIILNGGDQGIVNVTGALNAKGDNLGETGGTIHVLGDKVGLFDQALLDVSGYAGGGTALVGGDYQGLGSVNNSNAVYVGQDVTIKADALDEGDGGKVIVWSNDSTKVYGSISAKGGSASGDGGLIETSGKNYLDLDANVDASAANGNSGTWLLDPRNVNITTSSTSGSVSVTGTNPQLFTPTADSSNVDRDDIQTSLNAGTNVKIVTGATGSQDGDITVSSSITKTAGTAATLTLEAADDIFLNAAISGAVGFILNVILTAAGDVSLANSSADISTFGGSLTINADSNANGSGDFIQSGTGSGDSNIATANGNVSITADGINTDSGAFIDAGTGVVKFINSTSGRDFTLGGSSSGFDISDSAIDRVTAGSIEIGSANAGNISVNSFSPANANKLILIAGADVTEEGGGDAGADVTVGSLGIKSATGVNIDVDVTNLGVSNSGAGGVNITDTTGGMTVNAITNSGSTINGVTSGSGNIALTATGSSLGLADSVTTTGDVSLTAGTSINQTAGAISADDLTFGAGGAVTLNRTANQFNTVSGTTTSGAVDVADSGTNTTVIDLKTVGSTVNYSHTGAGNVTVTGTVSSGKADPAGTNGGNITLASSNLLTIASSAILSTVKGSGGVFSAGAATVQGGSTVTLGAGNITLTGGAAVLDTIINSPINGAVNIILTALRDVIVQSTITSTAGANVTITGDSDLDGSGGVWIQAAGGINSSGNVTLTGSSIFDAGTAGESIRIDADGANNQILAVGDITLQKSGAAPSTADINVNGIVNTGANIIVNSNDQITSSNNGVAEFVGNNLSLTAKNGIDVESNVTGVSINNSTSGNIAVEDMFGGLTLNSFTNGGTGTLTLLTHSPLTIAANLIQAATINLTAGESGAAGDDLTVNSGVTVQATGAGSDVNLNAGDNVVLSATSTVQSNTGAVNITAASGDTDNAGTISLAGAVSAGTNLLLSSLKGAITQTTGALTAPGTTTITATGQNVTLNSATNNFGTVASTGNNVALTDSNAIALGTSTVTGTLGVTANGAITDSGNLSVTGATTLAAGAANNITLDNSNNFSSVKVTTGKDVTLNDTGAINLDNSTISGFLNVTAGGLIDFVGNAATTIATTLGLTTTTGGINDSGSGSVAVTGTTTINATGAGNNVTLDNASNNFNAVAISSGNNVNLKDTNALTINNSTVTGTFNATSATGNLTLNTVTGATAATLTATTGSIIDGNGATNNLTATSLSATAATGIDLDTTIATLTSANVTGTGAIDINDLAGGLAVTSATTADGAIAINATGGNLSATTVTAAGTGRNVTLTTATSGNVNVDNITAAGDNIAITSVGNIEEIGGGDAGADLTSGTMNLTAATGIGNAAQLEIDATTLTNASVSGTGAINLSDLAGGLAVTSATTNLGNITLNAAGGNLNLTTVTASTAGGVGNINVTTTGVGSNVNVGNVTAAGDNITINSSAAIEELAPDAGTDLTSGTMNLTAVTGIGKADQLEINATTLTNASTTAAVGTINLSDTAGGLVVTSATTTDGAITLNATSGNLTLNSVIAGGTGRNVTVSTTTSGNIIVGLVSALNDIATFTSAGTIVEAVNDDAGAITSDINAGTINLTTGGGDIGQFTSYLDITPTTLWNATSNGGDIYVNCIGACPMGQINAGTGTFYYAGNITDGNDVVNGENNGGVWNILAGGVHLDADNTAAGFIGTIANWIEMRLSLYNGVANTNGRFVGTAGTGGIHMSNDVPANNALGLQIGGVSPSTITGITSSGLIEMYSFSPLVVAADVLATAGANIILAAMGNTTGDDVTVNANISATGGNGNISLIAGDDFNINNGSIVSAAGTGNVDVHAGEDFTDLNKTNRNGNVSGDINMENSGTAIRSQGGNITLDARQNIGLTEVNSDSNATGTQGDIFITTIGGAVNDNDGNGVNLIGDDVTIRSVNGIGGLVNNTIEMTVNSVDAINTTSGEISLLEVAGTGIGNSGALDIVRLQQNGSGDTFVRTTAGQMTILNAGAGGFGVTSTAGGDITLSTFGNGTNDLVINHNVSATNGGNVLLTAADDIRLNDGAVVSAFGGGTIEAHGGEDFADNNSTNRNGNAASDIVMEDSGTAFRTNSANITLDTRQNILITEIDADENGTGGMGDIFITTTGGQVDDNNGGALNLIGDDAVIRSVNGVGGLVNNTIETNLDSLDVINSTNGQISIQELASVSGNGNGDNLDLVRVQQTGVGTDETFIRTDSGALTVLATGAGGFGVNVQNGELTLLAQGAPAGTDDLIINNTVTSVGAKINLDSTDDIIASVDGDVTSTSGEIEADAADDILMSDNLGVNGTVWNAGTGQIDLDAGGDIRLTSVQTNNTSDEAVVLVAGGQIYDGGDTDVDIRTGLNGGMILRANSGIGSRTTGVNVNPNNAANNFATDALDAQGGRLAARTESGDIQISNTGALNVTTLTDTDGGTPMGSPGAGTLVGVLNNDAIHLDPASIIFITTHSPMTISSAVTNLDGGNISLYALGGLPTDTMTINANVQTFNGNGDVRVVSGGSMTMAPGTNISTQGDGVTSGTGQIAVGAGYNATGKAANEAFAPGVSLSDPSASLFDTIGDAGANLTMDETSRIFTEDGNILVDVQNVFTVGRVDADGNAGAAITDGSRGDITTFSRNGSTLDAEPADVGNLDFLANVLTMFSGDNIGLSTNHIEIDAPIFNAFAINNIFVDAVGSVLANMFSADGSIQFTATGDILLGTAHAGNGGVSLTAGGSILSQGGADTRVIARTPIQLTAGGVIGTAANAINTQLNSAGTLLINASSAINGLSANVTGNFSPLSIQVLNAPGLVLFNGVAVGGDPLNSLKGGIASLFQNILPQTLGQFGRLDGNIAPDYPGHSKLSEFGHVAEAPMDTTALDVIGMPGAPAAPAPEQRPRTQRVPQAPQPKTTPAPQIPAVQTTTLAPIVPAGSQTTPPTVVPIPDEAAPTQQELNVEKKNS